MVGVTGLEPATSRPPAVRATNCATPRRATILYSIKAYGKKTKGSGIRHSIFTLQILQSGYSQSPATAGSSY